MDTNNAHSLKLTTSSGAFGGDLEIALVCNLPKGSPCHVDDQGVDLGECNMAVWANEDIQCSFDRDQKYIIPVELTPWLGEEEGFRIKFKE